MTRPGNTPHSSISLPDCAGGHEKSRSIRSGTADSRKKKSVFGSWFPWPHRNRSSKKDLEDPESRHEFRIPGKVKDRKHFIRDELSDLTQTFNEMSDELSLQYFKLEERVQQRTAELELSKKNAETANESKTRFIANISHELKTPLNGILGQCFPEQLLVIGT